MDMRDIKFRVYNKDKKCFFHSDHTIGVDNSNQEIWGKVEIYTGLKDINGKEIYEGDICKIFFDVTKVEDWLYSTFTDTEIETGTREFIIESPIFNDQIEFSADEIEITGNIHS